MKTTSLAAAAALFASSNAASVLLQTTKCPDPVIAYGARFDVEMNHSGPVAKNNLDAICGLRIVSATDNIDVNTIQCQAFKDVVGTQPGSALFTYAQPALIATNPVYLRAIKCTYPIAPVVRRQDNGTSTASSGAVVTSTLTLPASSEASASVGPLTITSTLLVDPSSGIPGSSANATSTVTLSTTLRPTVTESSTSTQSSGAAGSMGVGMGVGVVAAVAAMFV